MFSTLTSPLFITDCRSKVFSPNFGGELAVVARSFPIGTTLDEIERGVVAAEFVSLSSDGRTWVDGWHTGPETGESVYVEKHTRGGASFHGYVDSVSRRVVQAG